MRLRKLFGTVVIVVFVATYALFAMVVGSFRLQESGTLERIVFFGVAGLLWVVPVGAVIWWMEKPGREKRPRH